MKLKSLIILALLFAMSTSLFGEHLFTFYDDDTCHLTQHDDSLSQEEPHCEIHCQYHHSYLLPQHETLSLADSTNYLPIQKNDSYIFNLKQKPIKPPIA